MTAQTKGVDVLAVLDAHVKMREMFLPVAGSDMCGTINPDPTNAGHAANIQRHADAVEARAAIAELIEALRIGVRQNSHDMLLTGDELRACEAALARCGSQP